MSPPCSGKYAKKYPSAGAYITSLFELKKLSESWASISSDGG